MITIKGTSFTVGGSVTIGAYPCVVDSVNYPSTIYLSNQVICVIPAGSGIVSLVLTTSLEALVANIVQFSYIPPTVIAVSPATPLPTAGMILFTITGTSFGSASTGQITIAGANCPSHTTHTRHTHDTHTQHTTNKDSNWYFTHSSADCHFVLLLLLFFVLSFFLFLLFFSE